MRSRRKIIDATSQLIEHGGFDAVNIAAVAETAGVSRQTIYSIFGTRNELVSQTVAEITLAVVKEIRARLDATDTPFEYLVELVVAGRAAVRTHPVMMALLQVGDANPLFDPDMMDRASSVTAALLQPLIDREPNLPDLKEIATVIMRMGLSIILFEDEYVRSDDDIREYLTRWLLPAMPFGL
ncbi:TetR/AcrR family transcriptional regulator [Rhodococcus sp. G-MC3]|uniref:TetR/AcrR family transcriptional regulator n=1 Tax=Rhodococcus sp. G-MC3 TaxID=3046209 RepID=UPI0024B8D608|nr:TetR/AcrR family transcriptional regulator [Rhodococcus sp. G-MC3]MDJ0394843.1 TetR/AcrR family transcriptional regulator [Rhodococcus sp. G-MC3]